MEYSNYYFYHLYFFSRPRNNSISCTFLRGDSTPSSCLPTSHILFKHSRITAWIITLWSQLTKLVSPSPIRTETLNSLHIFMFCLVIYETSLTPEHTKMKLSIINEIHVNLTGHAWTRQANKQCYVLEIQVCPKDIKDEAENKTPSCGGLNPSTPAIWSTFFDVVGSAGERKRLDREGEK